MLVQNQFEIENGILKAYVGEEAVISVPEGVHTIGEGVFKGMSWLLDVSLPASLKKIEAMAFKGCRKLKKLSFPEGLEEVGEYAFHRCHDLEELIFPKSMTGVGVCAFLYCDSLKKVVMEGPVNLGKALFSHDLMLQEISLNKNVDSSNFTDEVFEGCVHIHKITLSDEVYETDNLIEVLNSRSSYPETVKKIAESVYHSMQIEDGVLNTFSVNLKTISLPEGIRAIGKSCFFDKKGIVKIILPKSLEEIRANAFLNCINLEEITIQNEKLRLDERAFRGCNNLKTVNLSGESFSLAEESENELAGRIRDQVMGDFYISGRILVRYMGSEEQIRIPGEVEIIGERCFFGNEQLKTVVCPDGLSEIREQAFCGCVTLQNIILPDTLKRVEREAFAECRKLLKCNLPESLEYIGEYAFRRCLLLKPFEPWPYAAEIHPQAFYRAENLVRGEKKDFNGNPLVGDSIGEKFSENEPAGKILSEGKVSAEKILELKDVERIGKYAYAFSPDLEEVIIDAPECVIEKNAFANCPRLKKIRLNVKQLGKAAFAYSRNLSEVHLSGVSVLPAECFIGCYSLKKFEAKEIKRMEARCFDECLNLDFFDFSGIKLIGERAFCRCDSLITIKLDKVVCGYHAFEDCAGLSAVEITDDTLLKSGAFIGCTQIKTVIYNSEKYEFSKFSDSLNHTGNLRPGRVKEAIAMIFGCFDIREGKVLAGYSQDAVKVTVPENITEIGQDVFRDHVRLEEIIIPGSVKLFGNHAFTMTAWLDKQRKQSETVIVNGVLLDGTMCKGKTVIPEGVKRVAGWCFAGNTEITELTIPSVRIIVENLAFRNCINLKKITDWNGKEYVLSDVSDLTTQDYPELINRIFSECINCFKLDENRNLVESTGNIINLTFPEGIRSVGDGVYKDCHLLESIELSLSTEKIGKSAFENSKWLKSVSNAGAVSLIGAQAFYGCQSLEEIDLSDSLEEMGSRCFEHCCSLKEIYISNRLEKIPERAFFRCKSLQKLYIPKSVKIIEPEAFAFCEALEEVHIPKETKVSERAFAYCERVKIERYGGI